MQRILFLDHSAFIGGAELALADHIRHLDRASFEPYVACSPAMPALVEHFSTSGAGIETMDWPRLRGARPSSLARVPRAARRLRRIVENHGIDLVVANTARTAYIASVGLPRGVPLVWWVRDFDFGTRWFRLARRRPARIVCVSQAIRAHYRGVVDPKYVVVFVGSGLHARLDGRPHEELLALRRRWGIAPRDLVVGYLGRLVEDKGPEDLVDAVARVRGALPCVKLVMVGTGAAQLGDVEQRLAHRVADLGLDDVVRFTGFQSDRALYHRLFDIFVISSRYREAMPMTAIEAMMARTPVIATRTGGTPEVVIDGETGLLVPPRAPAAIADAILRLASDPALVRSLTTTAHERAMSRHREEIVTKQVEETYTSVLSGRADRRSDRAR
jgi:glycosyltransferase involved in cell wall biosynthesis